MESEQEVAVAHPETLKKMTSTHFSFSDLEKSLEAFDGESSNKSVTKWVHNFEETAEIYNWDELQNNIYFAENC